MSEITQNKYKEYDESKMNFAVTRYEYDDACNQVRIDISIYVSDSNFILEVYGVCINKSPDFIEVLLPTRKDYKTGQEMHTMQFGNFKDWDYICKKIKEDVRSKPWLISLLDGDF